jgi:hypothetical protein
MPQGHPVIVQAGASEQGRELGAATADVIYAISGSLGAARAYYDDVKGRMAKYGREPDELKIMPASCCTDQLGCRLGPSRCGGVEDHPYFREREFAVVGQDYRRPVNLRGRQIWPSSPRWETLPHS